VDAARIEEVDLSPAVRAGDLTAPGDADAVAGTTRLILERLDQLG